MLNFIKSLNYQTLLPLELIIVDASETSSEEIYREELRPDINLKYWLVKSPGTTYQRNFGAQKAQGDILAIYDDDVILEADFLAEILQVFQSDSDQKIGAVCGKITNNPLRSKVLFRLHRFGAKIIKKIFFLQEEGPGNFKKSGFPRPFDYQKLTRKKLSQTLSGCTATFRKEVFLNYLYDEQLTGYSYMDDADLGYRLSRKYQIVFTPFAKCEHRASPSNRLNRYEASRMLIRNHRYLFKKNFPQTLSSKTAHALSLIGYPILQMWNLNWKGCWGSFTTFY